MRASHTGYTVVIVKMPAKGNQGPMEAVCDGCLSHPSDVSQSCGSRNCGLSTCGGADVGFFGKTEAESRALAYLTVLQPDRTLLTVGSG